MVKKEKYNIAVAGATGAVGRKMLEILEEREFPIANLKALASARSVGQNLPFKGSTIKVEELCENSFDGVDIALAGLANRHTSNTEYVAEASMAGCAHTQLTVAVTTAGNSNTGVLYLYIR